LKHQYSRRSILIAAVLILLGVAVYTQYRLSHHAAKPLPVESQAVRSEVKVITVSPSRYQAVITGYGSAEPRYRLELSSQISGQVSKLSPHFASGNIVKAGDLLAQVDDAPYKAALSAAARALADAKLALLEEERQALQARREWQASNIKGEPDSELVLREPQLRVARAAVAEADAALANARNNLNHTQIKAPFDAIISRRDIAPGSYVQTGTVIALLDDSQQLELSLPLAARDWLQLPSDLASLSNDARTVSLNQVETGQQWQGVLSRSELHRDSETRQRAAIVTINAPLTQTPPLLPGTFVQATLLGRWVDNLWQLPASALSQRGEIWYVDSSDILRKFTAASLFNNGGFVYIPVPKALAASPQKVVIHPLSSYLPGVSVHAVMPVTAETVTAGASGDE